MNWEILETERRREPLWKRVVSPESMAVSMKRRTRVRILVSRAVVRDCRVRGGAIMVGGY